MAAVVSAPMDARIRARALELFLRDGVDATPLREIAVGLEVTKAALYYHYPSKDALLHALVTPYLDDLGACLLRHEERTNTVPVRELIAELVTLGIDHRHTAQLATDPAVRRSVRLGERHGQLGARRLALVARVAGDVDQLRVAAALGALDAVTAGGPSAPPERTRVVTLVVDLLGHDG